MHDPLDAILGPMPPAPPPESLFPLTLKALRRARRRQRAAQLASLLACAAAGLIVLLALAPECPGPRSREAAPADKGPAPDAPAATALEWRALEGAGPSAPVYRQAGDRYLDEGDPENAVRCYGHALSEGGEATDDLLEADSYLLMAIKLARKKEREKCDR
jgi:hypothetical protein